MFRYIPTSLSFRRSASFYRPFSQLFKNAKSFGDRRAINDHLGVYTYKDLLNDSNSFRTKISSSDLKENRISFLCPNDYDYVVTQWAVWQAGGTAVPLCLTHPAEELEYTISHSRSSMVIASESLEERVVPIAKKLNIPFLRVPKERKQGNVKESSVELEPNRSALMIYTSGTTGKPKGVVITHGNLESGVKMLVDAWEWIKDDHILQFLPLHHIHGVINILTCALYSGAFCSMVSFNADNVWNKLRADPSISVFMAVPTIYVKLIEAYEKYTQEKQQLLTQRTKQLRLMVSGSAALPSPVFDKWEEISGHRLLERYGMTEILMAIGSPIRPITARIPGRIGVPFPGVEIKLKPFEENPDPSVGEILVKSPCVFKEYFDNPTATADTFTEDGWFKTGDIAQRFDDGTFKILGRNSVDIIKSGGYKISALDIERELLSHPKVGEAIVVGVPHPVWGEQISAMIIKKNPQDGLSEEELVNWLKERLANYKIPRKIVFVSEIPKNAMGKVSKKELLKNPLLL